MLAKFKAAGLTDVRSPAVRPRAAVVPAVLGRRGRGRRQNDRARLGAAGLRHGGTPPEGLDLEAVYVGLGSEADFAGPGRQGQRPSSCSRCLALRTKARCAAPSDKGAAAIFEVNMLPGNARYQAYPARDRPGPAFTVGHDDGDAAREIIAAMPAGQSARVKVKLSVERVPNLKTALVWGTLPGATDETIYIMAHRDGWFDASGDNASGVASMIGAGGALRQDSAGTAQADDGLHRARRPPQLRRRFGGRQ